GQDVATPDQEIMDQAEEREERQPPELQPAPTAARPGAFDEQVDTGPEQQREQAAELVIDEDGLEQPDVLVARSRRLGQRLGPEIGHVGLAERGDVGEQDAEDGNAANEIERN